MSIDLSGVVGVSDDYGVVTQIADASGRVLWSAVQNVTITITNALGGTFSTKVMMRILGTEYSFTSASQTVSVPIGTVIEIYNASLDCKCGEEQGRLSVTLNGASYASTRTSTTYTITDNATITLSKVSRYDDCYECAKDYFYATVDITET